MRKKRSEKQISPTCLDEIRLILDTVKKYHAKKK